MYYHNKVNDYISKEIVILRNLDANEINKVINILDECLQKGKKVYVFGNGGSGSTASHMANDFNKALFKKTDKAFNFVCLNDNIPTVLAIANDEGYDEIFRINKISTEEEVTVGNGKEIEEEKMFEITLSFGQVNGFEVGENISVLIQT